MRKMSKCILLLPMIAASCTALPQASQQPTISIDTKSPTFKLGRPIQLHIDLKNTTDQELTIFRSVGSGHGEHYYSISVTGPDGKPAARTEYGAAIQKQHRPVAGSKIMKTIAPGGDVDEYVLLTRMFDMRALGTYIVQASRASPLDRLVTLKSNALTISIID